MIAIVNISSFIGLDASAIHFYGNLILCEKDNIIIDNITEYNVKYLGENIELEQPLTKEIAKSLDKIDGEGIYHRMYLRDESTSRFKTEERVIEIAKMKYEKLDLDCPFIVLYEGKKYDEYEKYYIGV